VLTAELPNLPKGSTVLVTGAGGFIGGRLAECLVAGENINVRCLVRNRGRAPRLQALPIEIIEGSTCSRGTVDLAVSSVDYVFHCAYDPSHPEENIAGTKNLLEACSRQVLKRLVHLSSFAVYQPFPDGKIDESTPDGDRSIDYVDTKLRLERLVLDYHASAAVPITILQPAIVYGPFCWVWTRRPAEMLLSGEVVLPDGGTGICNAVYVDDLIQAMLLSAINPRAVANKFIVSGPAAPTWRDFFQTIANAVNANPPVFWPTERVLKEHQLASLKNSTPWRKALRGLSKSGALRLIVRVGHKLRFDFLERNLGRWPKPTLLPALDLLNIYNCRGTVSIERAHRVIGYQPKFELEDGMAITQQYLQSVFRVR
jgi:nucleoside-diphosphate-sugar epimerase